MALRNWIRAIAIGLILLGIVGALVSTGPWVEYKPDPKESISAKEPTQTPRPTITVQGTTEWVIRTGDEVKCVLTKETGRTIISCEKTP